MTRRLKGMALMAIAGAAALGGLTFLVASQPSGNKGPLRPEPLTRFEREFVNHVRSQGVIFQDATLPAKGGNARGIALGEGSAAILNVSVEKRKYGISLDGTQDVLIKNFTFIDRNSKDAYGAGLILGQKSGTRGQTWLSNAWIDLNELGPNPNYRWANNEGISVELDNGPLNIRRAVLIGAEDAGIDNKGHVRMDGSFIASGHRPVRLWSGSSLILANTTVLAHPGYGGFWFGGEGGVARLDYYNCRFGRVGDPPEELSDEIPDWMISREGGVKAQIRRLPDDPFDRSSNSFWAPALAPVPVGYLQDKDERA